MKKIKICLLLMLATPIVLAARGPVKISQIKADPARFGTKTVQVKGTVVTSVGVLASGGYEIEDETGRIYVITNKGVPSQGAHVIVEGTVFTGATVFGQPVGVAIRESKHQIKP